MAVPYHTHTFEIPAATKEDVEAGVRSDVVATPSSLGSAATKSVSYFATASQGNSADTAVQPTLVLIAGDGLTGGGTLAANRTFALSSTSLASLVLANSAVQRVNGKSGTSILLTADDVSAVPASFSDDIALNTAARHGHANKAVLDAVTAAYTITEKTKLSGISEGATANTGTVTSVGVAVPVGLAATGAITTSGTITISYAAGYQGYTAAEANKLAGIAAGAQVNTVTSVAGKPGAVTLNAGDVSAATSVQGAKADTALQAAGGTTGQVLVKTSNANNAVEWVTSEAATAVSYAPQTLDATQQTQARTNISAASAVQGDKADYAVRYDAQALTAQEQGQARANIDAGILSGFRNKLINGDFFVTLRGTSFVITPLSPAIFTADRWAIYNSTNAPVSVEIVDDGVSPRTMMFNFTSEPTTGAITLFQKVEDVRTLPSGEATLTFSMFLENSMRVFLYGEQNFGSSGSATNVISINNEVEISTTDFTKKSVVFSVDSIAGKTVNPQNSNFNTCIQFHPRSIGSFGVRMVSLVSGDATAEIEPFSPRSVQQEIALCERYYQIHTDAWVPPTSRDELYRRYTISARVWMRATPSVSVTSSISGVNIFVEGNSPHGTVIAANGVATNVSLLATGIRLDAEL